MPMYIQSDSQRLRIGIRTFQDSQSPRMVVKEGDSIIEYGCFDDNAAAAEWFHKLAVLVGVRKGGE